MAALVKWLGKLARRFALVGLPKPGNRPSGRQQHAGWLQPKTGLAEHFRRQIDQVLR